MVKENGQPLILSGFKNSIDIGKCRELTLKKLRQEDINRGGTTKD
jgi:hypothetical protein